MQPVAIKTFSVRELNEFTHRTLSEHVGAIVVEGELSGVRVRNGRWLLFNLVDGESTVDCFAARLDPGIEPKDGLRVRILATPRIYVPYGRYSLTVEAMEAVGAGPLQAAYEALYRTLKLEGLFRMERKRALPKFPERIGIITSADGAAVGDVRKVIRERWGGITMILRHVAVQGTTAAKDIVRSLDSFNERERVDVVILTRGGGSAEDLSAFNDEHVIRAVFASAAPVIAAIGHEKDVTLAELVADARGATPSHAAQLAVPDRQTVTALLGTAEASLRHALHNRYERTMNTLTARADLLSLRTTVAHRNAQHRLDRAASTITQATHRIDTASLRLDRIGAVLASLDPQRILTRGYSFTTNRTTGTILRSIRDVSDGDRLETRLADGSVLSEVIHGEETAV